MVRQARCEVYQGVRCTHHSDAAAAGAACMEFNKSGTRYSYMF